MITGMRWSAGGAQHVYGVRPDLSTWGKALGNGFPVSALAGRRELMELGGLRTDAPRVFLLSTTHGPETAGLAAYLAVARAYRERDVIGEMEAAGTALADGACRPRSRPPGSPSSCRCSGGRAAWSSPPATRRDSRRRPSAPCSCRS